MIKHFHSFLYKIEKLAREKYSWHWNPASTKRIHIYQDFILFFQPNSVLDEVWVRLGFSKYWLALGLVSKRQYTLIECLYGIIIITIVSVFVCIHFFYSSGCNRDL